MSTMENRTAFILVVICLVAGMLQGCATFLPKSKDTALSPWKSFADAMAAYDRITPLKTTAEELKQLGFDLKTSPNMQVLNYLDIAKSVQPLKYDDLDPGLQTCLSARGNCSGYEFTPSNVTSERNGNFWLDILNFNRKTKTEGWRFRALVVIVDGVVVYKLWGGLPHIEENKEMTNPLGPLQEPSGRIIRWLPF